MNQRRLSLPNPLAAPELPRGWAHPRLWLHRTWYARRTWQWRARAALILTVPLLIAVITLKLHPLWLLLALLPTLLPTGVRPSATLREIETLNGAYATALVAPEDEFGFRERLERQALSTQMQTDPPAWPLLELAGIAALCSLLLVFPPRLETSQESGRNVSREQLEAGRGNGPEQFSNDAPPVLDAPSRNAAPGGGDARPGQAASGGAIGESQVGDLKPGGGRASDNPEAISKEFMDALERGSVRERGGDSGSGQSGQRVEDRDNPGLAQQGSAGGDGSNNDPSGSGGQRSGSGKGKQGQQPGQGQNGQSGQNPGAPQPGKNGNGAQGGQNGTGSGNDPQAQGGQQGNSARNGTSKNGRGNDPSLAEDPSESFNSGRDGNAPNQRSQPGKGGRGTSDPSKVGAASNGKGKLEYLPGTVRGSNVRSGVLQLPGDPRQPLTGTPGTPGYKRAAESAILDPKLPPEYQELLKNYYK